MHVSQSGISAQIRQLERDLGADLFDRSGRTATLTAAGNAAMEHARAVLASAAALRQAVDEVNGLVRGQLAVGMVTACTVTALFDGLSAFHQAHPAIEITLTEGHSDLLVDQVRSGDADVALIGAAGELPEGVEGRTVISENLVAAVPPGHPLAALSSVGLAELARYPVLTLSAGTGVRAVYDQACASAGLRPSIAFRPARRPPWLTWPAEAWEWRSSPPPWLPSTPIGSPRCRSPGLRCRACSLWSGERRPAPRCGNSWPTPATLSARRKPAPEWSGLPLSTDRGTPKLPRLLEVSPDLIGDLVNLLLGLLE